MSASDARNTPTKAAMRFKTERAGQSQGEGGGPREEVEKGSCMEKLEQITYSADFEKKKITSLAV